MRDYCQLIDLGFPEISTISISMPRSPVAETGAVGRSSDFRLRFRLHLPDQVSVVFCSRSSGYSGGAVPDLHRVPF